MLASCIDRVRPLAVPRVTRRLTGCPLAAVRLRTCLTCPAGGASRFRRDRAERSQPGSPLTRWRSRRGGVPLSSSQRWQRRFWYGGS